MEHIRDVLERMGFKKDATREDLEEVMRRRREEAAENV
jgi:hypothetical protein